MPLPFAIGALGIKDYIIAGLAALVLLLSLGTYLKVDFLFVHIEGWKPWGERMETERDTANLKLGVSNKSIADLEAKITELNAEANHRADLFEISQQEAAREAESLERAARVSQGQIDRLRALAAAEGTCAVPGELSDALGGL